MTGYLRDTVELLRSKNDSPAGMPAGSRLGGARNTGPPTTIAAPHHGEA